jgi:hypothetical protein
MSEMENRLSEAFRSAACTITSDSVGTLSDLINRRSQPNGWPRARRGRRLLPPIAAAAAVTVIAVLAAVILPGILGRPPSHGPAAAHSAPKFLIAYEFGSPVLQVRDVATGALVAQVKLPKERGRQTLLGTMTAIGNGRTFVLDLSPPSPCGSWLYQLQLNGRGQPTTLIPFPAFHGTATSPTSVYASSSDGRMLAYEVGSCYKQKFRAPYLVVLNTVTGKKRQWTLPTHNGIAAMSLSANGNLLAYATDANPSDVRVMPTNAAPGSLTQRSRAVAAAAQFGEHDLITFAAISADGSHVSLSVYPELAYLPKGQPLLGQVRVTDIATGQSRLVRAHIPAPGPVTADPSGRFLLVETAQPHKGVSTPPVRLAILDLKTGELTPLPSAWITNNNIPDLTW